jgi:hypothetical protein
VPAQLDVGQRSDLLFEELGGLVVPGRCDRAGIVTGKFREVAAEGDGIDLRVRDG